ncbi:MAG: MFS transporter [Lentisphaeria bacterium]
MNNFRKLFSCAGAEGIFSQIHIALAGIGSAILTNFMLFLGASNFQFSLLTAMGQLSNIFQPLGIIVACNIRNRKQSVILFMLAGRILPFFFGFIGILANCSWSVPFFLILFFICTALQAIANNLWIAWIANDVPLYMRGRFFSYRSKFTMFGNLLAGYGVGALVDLFVVLPSDNEQELSLLRQFFPSIKPLPIERAWIVFALVFLLAVVCGLIGVWFLKMQPEKPQVFTKEVKSFNLLKSPFSDANFRRLIFFGIWWMLAIGIGSPYWQPFMKKSLQMSLVQMQLYSTLGVISSLLVLKSWGIFIDRYGNKIAMSICIIIGAFNPLPWLFVTADSLWLIYLEGITSGIMWSGVGIVISNFVLSIAPKNSQQAYSGMNSAISGLSWAISALASGLFIPTFSISLFSLNLLPEQTLFALTSFARFSAIIPLWFIYEKKATEQINKFKHKFFGRKYDVLN